MNNKIRQNITIFLAGKDDDTERRYAFALNQYLEWGGRFKPQDAAGFIAYLYESDYADNTIRCTYHALHSICDFLIAVEALPSNPFKAARRVISFRQKRQVRPTATIDPTLILPAIEAIKPTGKGVRDRAIFAILFGCGLRRSELTALKMRDIRVSGAKTLYAFIDRPKGGKSRKQPIPEWAEPMISELVSKRSHDRAKDADPLFASTYGDNFGRPISDETVHKTFRKRFEGAPHSARAAFATQLLSLGYDEIKVAQALGHSDTQQVRTYDHREHSVDNNIGRLVNY